MTSIGLICCAVLCLIVVTLIIRPFFEFIVRICVIEKRGVFDSIREGFRMVRANRGNVAILYLLIIGVGIGFGILMIPIGLVLIIIPAGIGFAIYFATQAVTTAVIVGFLIAIPFILAIIFINGLFLAFESSVWTEGYLAINKPPTVAPQNVLTS